MLLFKIFFIWLKPDKLDLLAASDIIPLRSLPIITPAYSYTRVDDMDLLFYLDIGMVY